MQESRPEKSVVPFTDGVLYEQLCHTRWASQPIAPGTLLARDGAWQRKYVVTHVEYQGVETKSYKGNDKIYYQHTFIVGIRLLGNFFADGRMEPSKKPSDREVRVTTFGPEDRGELIYVDGHAPVETFVLPAESVELYAKRVQE